MAKLSEKKRKWIIQQFMAGRSATSIASIQKISRRLVYRNILKKHSWNLLSGTMKNAFITHSTTKHHNKFTRKNCELISDLFSI